MIYELRVYHCVPGRLPDLIKRFDTLTLPLWKKHGIQQAGFWTVAIGPSNRTFICSNGNRSTIGRRDLPGFRPIRNGSPDAPRPKRTVRSSLRSLTLYCSRPASRR